MAATQATTHTAYTGRPTLPSIHSLNLPFLTSRHSMTYTYPQPMVDFHHVRRVSTSSTCTSTSSCSRDEAFPPSSREGSPSCGNGMDVTTRATLIPCDLSYADALVVVPLSSAPPSYSLSSSSSSPSTKPPTLIFTGHAVDHVKRAQHVYSRHARLHPYRIVKSSRGRFDESALNVVRATPVRPPHSPSKSRVKFEF